MTRGGGLRPVEAEYLLEVEGGEHVGAIDHRRPEARAEALHHPDAPGGREKELIHREGERANTQGGRKS